MTDSLQKTPREKSIEKGKQIIVALIAYFMLNDILSTIIKLLSGQAIAVDIIRFAITIVMCIYLYKGQNWAKLFLSFGASLWLFIDIYSLSSIESPYCIRFLFCPFLHT